MDLQYKAADKKDIPLLLNMMEEFYNIEHLPYNIPVITSGLKKLFNNSSFGNTWLIYQDDQPAGYITVTYGFSLEFHGVDALVDEFYIREEFRGKGIGKKTLSFVEGELHSKGIEAIHLEVDRQNVYAQEVYRKYGFKDHDRYLLTKWIDRNSK